MAFEEKKLTARMCSEKRISKFVMFYKQDNHAMTCKDVSKEKDHENLPATLQEILIMNCKEKYHENYWVVERQFCQALSGGQVREVVVKAAN